MTGAANGDGTRARILAIARRRLSADGAQRLTVTRVAEEAGMAHSNVYRYFPSKVALIDALTAEWLQPLEDQLAAAADAPDPAPDKLERMILAVHHAYRESLRRDPPGFEAFVTAFSENRGVARRHRARLRMLVDRVVDEGLSAGAFQQRDRTAAVTLVLDASYRFVHPAAVWLDRDQPDLERRRLDRVLEAAIGHLTRRPSR